MYSLHCSILIKRERKDASMPPTSRLPRFKNSILRKWGNATSTPPSSEASHPITYSVDLTTPVTKDSKRTTVHHFKHAYLLRCVFFLNCPFSGCTEPKLSIYSLLVWLSKDWKKGTILQTSKSAHESFTVWKPSLTLWQDKREVRTYYGDFILTTIM